MLFSLVDHIDDDGRPLAGEFYPDHYRTDWTRAQLVERLFHVGCVFFGVTAFTERQVLLDAGPYDPFLLQTQDLDCWIRLIKRYNFEILPDRLYLHRIRDARTNLSTPTPEHTIRFLNEVQLIMRRFFDDMPPELCRAAFREQLIDSEFQGATEYACEQAFLYLRPAHRLTPLLGIEKLHHLMQDPGAAALLRDKYNLTHRRIFELTSSFDVMNLYASQRSILWVDAGQGWDASRVLHRPVDTSASFEHTFELSDFGMLRQLAWSPLEGRPCRVKIGRVTLQDLDGSVRELDSSALRSNGILLPDGTHVFETPEPRFFIDLDGALGSVTIQGDLESDPVKDSLFRLSLPLAEARATLAGMHASRSWRVTAPLRVLSRVARKWRQGALTSA